MNKLQQTKLLVIDSGPVQCQLTFAQNSDRWSHVCEFMLDGNVIGTFNSVEGNADDAWPTSPPFQELLIESRVDQQQREQQVALLIGMSGKSHWSCSVTPIQEADRIGWEFDVACRVRELPVQLGSRYLRETDQESALAICEAAAISGCNLKDQNIVCNLGEQSIPRTECWKYQLVTIVR